jgi:hypothetical protein
VTGARVRRRLEQIQSGHGVDAGDGGLPRS